MEQLNSEQRLQLMRLVCALAWVDEQVQQAELGFIAKLMFKINMPAAEMRQVKRWLEVPPEGVSADARAVPREHRQLFLDACRGLVWSDGTLTGGEQAVLERLEKALE
jgi:uncharacterized tellurite resistance protein B-like protein